ncbi:MAG TPA: YkgJ family cysteine cluster protein [Polyangiaceae bacterium]|nr:YkgJ family cysteine cluster protein [Polyangiaceae bacterium]
MVAPVELLRFRCTGCGNCCRDPLLPLTDSDLARISEHTGDAPADIVRFIDKDAIDLDNEPEAFVSLRQGRRVMVLRHQLGACRYLGDEDRCRIYAARPLGCRIFPFDPSYDRRGKLKRLKLIDATDCKYELDGSNDPCDLKQLHAEYQTATQAYQRKIAEWNRRQQRRRRAGNTTETTAQFFAFLGLLGPEARKATP